MTARFRCRKKNAFYLAKITRKFMPVKFEIFNRISVLESLTSKRASNSLMYSLRTPRDLPIEARNTIASSSIRKGVSNRENANDITVHNDAILLTAENLERNASSPKKAHVVCTFQIGYSVKISFCQRAPSTSRIANDENFLVSEGKDVSANALNLLIFQYISIYFGKMKYLISNGYLILNLRNFNTCCTQATKLLCIEDTVKTDNIR